MKAVYNVVCGLMLLLASSASAQSFNIMITQTPNATGGVEFELNVTSFDIFGTLIAPGGRRFSTPGGPPGSPTSNTLPGLSFAQITSGYMGAWVIERRPPGPPNAPPLVYDFAVAPFTLADVFDEVPFITSPANNSLVPTSFVLEWDYPAPLPAGVGRGATRRGGTGATVTFGSFGVTTPNSIDVDVVLNPGVTAATATFQGGSHEILNRYLSPVTGRNGAALPPFMGVSLAFRNLSAPVTVTVVPEPSSVVLLGGLLVGGLAVARRMG